MARAGSRCGSGGGGAAAAQAAQGGEPADQQQGRRDPRDVGHHGAVDAEAVIGAVMLELDGELVDRRVECDERMLPLARRCLEARSVKGVSPTLMVNLPPTSAASTTKKATSRNATPRPTPCPSRRCCRATAEQTGIGVGPPAHAVARAPRSARHRRPSRRCRARRWPRRPRQRRFLADRSAGGGAVPGAIALEALRVEVADPVRGEEVVLRCWRPGPAGRSETSCPAPAPGRRWQRRRRPPRWRRP